MANRRVIFCGFQDVHADFLRTSTIKKGKRLWESHHVFQVKEEFCISTENIEERNDCIKPKDDAGLSNSNPNEEEIYSIITGKVIRQANVTLEPYEVFLKVTKSRKILNCYCKCPAGKDQCKHVAALCQYINNDESISKTSQAQEWGKPGLLQKQKYKKGKTINELFPPSDAIQRNESPLTVPKILNKIKDVNCPMSHILKAEEIKECDTLVCSAGQIKNSKKKETIFRIFNRMTDSNYTVFSSSDKFIENINSDLNALYSTYNISVKEMEATCFKTLRQASSGKWKKEREVRITATKAGRILSRKKDFEKLATDLLYPSDYKSASMIYGTETEKIARKSFQDLIGVEVEELGLVISVDHPWLACSPDGVFNLDGHLNLLEIKCPYSCESKSILNWDTMVSNVTYLKLIDGSGFNLSEKHAYFAQIQISLYVLKINVCYFYVYSKCEKDIWIKIERDEEFLKTAIPKLEWFYFEHYLPSILVKRRAQIKFGM